MALFWSEVRSGALEDVGEGFFPGGGVEGVTEGEEVGEWEEGGGGGGVGGGVEVGCVWVVEGSEVTLLVVLEVGVTVVEVKVVVFAVVELVGSAGVSEVVVVVVAVVAAAAVVWPVLFI